MSSKFSFTSTIPVENDERQGRSFLEMALDIGLIAPSHCQVQKTGRKMVAPERSNLWEDQLWLTNLLRISPSEPSGEPLQLGHHLCRYTRVWS